jgi:hypothetical protein
MMKSGHIKYVPVGIGVSAPTRAFQPMKVLHP